MRISHVSNFLLQGVISITNTQAISHWVVLELELSTDNPGLFRHFSCRSLYSRFVIVFTDEFHCIALIIYNLTNVIFVSF